VSLVAPAGRAAPGRSRPIAGPPLEALRVPMREPGVPGGRFVMVSTSDARTFNPIMSSETSSSDVSDRLFTALATFNNATQEFDPALATRWEQSPDGRTWTFHLRRGARFSDGRPITSADVLFSFAVAYDTTLHPPIQDGLEIHGEPIEIRAPDAGTVVMRIRRPFALMIPTVASLRIVPRHVLEPLWRAGRFASAYGVNTPPESLVTSGPWRLERYVPHERTVLARNRWWFGVDGHGRRLPYLDQLVFLIVPDQNTAMLQFQSKDGEVDALDNVKPEDYADLARRQTEGDYTLYDLGPTLTSNCLWLNLNTAKTATASLTLGQPYVGAVKYSWFSNRDFRRAISLALDRDAMIRSVFFGAGVKNWSLMTPGNKLFYNHVAPAFDFDLDQAKRLLASQGFVDRDGDGVVEDSHGNPVRFTLKTAGNNNARVQLANFVRDDLARIGIQVTLTPVDPNGMVASIQDRYDYDAALGGLGTVIPPDPAMGANFYRSSGATHFWNARQSVPATAEEARLDSLFEAIESTTRLPARQRLSAEMDQVIGEQCWVIWLPVNDVKVPIRNRFGNLAPSSIRHRVLWNIETVFVRPTARKPPG
jgi:peptide/nickel transport system substrate-binding protein